MPLSDHARENFPYLLREVQAAGARLVAVSKTQPDDKIMALYALGQRDFGENRVSELSEKVRRLPADIRWHYLGNLQRNKVKALLPLAPHLIHSVDSERLLFEIAKVATQQSLTVALLLQFHIAEEETKSGFQLSEAQAALNQWFAAGPKPGLRICGVMGMATNTENDETIATEFKALTKIFKQLKNDFFPTDPSFCEISMGMSGDYPIALEQGSTLVRVGSLLFS
ncbi:MAG: YggS family pyridoxal phosphate-dependent enzyme [Lewinella sp.]|nr:YggS family pyridoxal phosphate-dependent enzyme [Lewinella sp.]